MPAFLSAPNGDTVSVLKSVCHQDRERERETGTRPRELSGCEIMRVWWVLLCSCLLVVLPPTAAEGGDNAGGRREREKRSLPYWGLWSADFFGWLEELRAQAAEAGMQDLARTFWAHFPIANQLGYDSPESDYQPEE